MKREYVWVCDFCGKEFSTKKKSDQHELKCPKRKEKDFKVIINFGKINRKKIFNSTLLFLVLYLMLFGLINSYAKANSLPPRNILKPSEWLGKKEKIVEEKNTPAPTPNEIINPTPTIKSQVNNSSNQNTNNSSAGLIDCIGPNGKQFKTTLSECEKLNKEWGKQTDYIVNCNIHVDCGGGTQGLAKSVCDNSVCCEIPKGTWVFYTSKQKCSEDQNSTAGSSNSSTFQLKTPQCEEKTCRSEGGEDISTYLKLMTQYLKDYNETGIDSFLDTGVEYEKKYYEAIARYCTP